MVKTDVLILGGGLAGLSAAYHLNRLGSLDSLVVEKGATVGGTAGSERHGDFLFDHTGHLLHLHDAYGKKLILGLLKGNWALHQRNSWIHSQGVDTRYPFQANTFGLPWESVEDCAVGYLKTVHRPGSFPQGSSFRDWSLRTFGKGICERFMFPYNEKLWRAQLSRMTTEWQGRFVPKPGPAEVLYGALMDQKKFFGYNADFRYPVRGGIQVLPDALAARLKAGQVRTNCAVRYVDLASNTAVVENLGEVSFSRLINTMPLVDFLDCCWPLPEEVTVARMKLRYNTVYNLNLGVARARMSDKHWIYFPEKKYPFYRVGYSSNFSPHLAPKGASSLYVEVSRRSDEKVDLKKLENGVLSGLRSAGILRSSDRLLAKVWMPIRCGYVVYDFDRTPAVNAIFKHLGKLGVESIGRYGAWKYSFMEETILDGQRCAQRLLGVKPAKEKAAAVDFKALK